MFRADTIKLIEQNPDSHGIFDTHTTTEREVFCEVRSIGMTEAYTAMAHGFNPEVKFILALAEDYQNERTLKWNGVTYKVLRTYINGDGIELTAGRIENNV